MNTYVLNISDRAHQGFSVYLSDKEAIKFLIGPCHLQRMGFTMNNKIETLIRQYKREPEVEDQITILVAARREIDQLHKTLAKTIR